MQNIILLSGPSIADVDATKFPPSSRIFAINRKSKIESDVLKGNVGYWYIASPPEFSGMLDEVYEFLGREDNNRLLTTTLCLAEVFREIKANPLPNSEKILIVDQEIEEVHSTHGGKNHWNSLAVLLYFLSSRDPEIATYIFGMDGVANQGDVSYFNKEDLSGKRLVYSRLYEDMKFFDENILDLLTSNNVGPKIYNMNKDSYYQVLPKVNTIPTTPFNRFSEIISSFGVYGLKSEDLLELVKKRVVKIRKESRSFKLFRRAIKRYILLKLKTLMNVYK